MSQPSPSICPQCRAPIGAGQRFCLNCGAPATPESVRPTEPASYSGYISNVPSGPSAQVPYGINPTPPLYNTNDVQQTPQPYTHYNAQPAPPPPPVTPYSPYSVYEPKAQKPKSSKRRINLIIGGVIVLLLLSIGAYALINRGGGGGGPLGTGPAPSEPLNLTATYANDQITVTSVQQAAKFSDDTYYGLQSQPDVIRVNTKEKGLSSHFSFFSYTTNFRLTLPDKSIISASKAQNYDGPQTGVQRTNWIDFGVSKQYDLSQLTLIIGAADEQQISIPLQANADLTKYQPKTSTPNKKVEYSGLDWTLVTATQSLSADGTQAKTGQIYVTITLNVDNVGTEDFFGYDFLRLKSGETVASATTTSSLNFPDQIKAGTTNVSASTSFLVPPSGSYTLIFQPGQYSHATQQSIVFTI